MMGGARVAVVVSLKELALLLFLVILLIRNDNLIIST